MVGFGTTAGSFGLASETSVPGVSRYWPRTTTVSPALNPLSIKRLAIERFAHRHRLHRDLVTPADDKDKLPLRPLLDGVERDRQAIILHFGHEPDIDEHAGPQPAVRIREILP